MTELNFDIYLTPTQRAFVYSEAPIVWLISGQGEGKCEAQDTLHLMFDGTIKKVQDIRVGDLLMGPDSKPRKVLSLTRGRDQMYEIVPTKGDSFIVNQAHILSLRRSKYSNNLEHEKKFPEIVNISVKEYLQKTTKFKLHHPLYRVPVQWSDKETPLDPYFMGIWLGDGSKSRPAITTKDAEIIAYLYHYAHKYNLNIRVADYKGTSCPTYYLSMGNVGSQKNNPHPILKHLPRNDKHIPHEYLINSKEKRLELLAGIIDTDGTPNRTSYQISQKSEKLTDDILFLARSLGFAAYKKKVQKKCCNNGKVGEYFNITIDGDCHIIPVRIKKKKVPVRKQKKSVLVTGIKKIIDKGIDNYYGFTISGDHLYLLSDFTVTHNSFSAFVALLMHTRFMNGRVLKAAIVRDTFQNIKTMTIPSVEDAIDFMAEQQGDAETMELFKNSFIWSDGGKKLTGPGIDVDLFGIDDLGSLTKLQGGEYSFIWLEEPAPMFERANAGLSEEVFISSLSRVARQRNAKPRLQITQNPPEENHWTWKRAIIEPLVKGNPQFPDIYSETFRIPYGENPFLSNIQRQTAKAAFANDPGLWARYIEGKAAFIIQGEAVTPEYDEDMHRSKKVLEPYPGVRGIRFWDGGHNPSCLIAQIHPVSGRLCEYDTLVGENIGMIQLVRGMVKPLLLEKYKKVREWFDTGDPAVRTRDGSNTDMSPAKIIESELGTKYVSGVKNWDARVQAIKYVLQNSPMLLLCPKEKKLHEALRGGWHYKKNNDGTVIKGEAVKNLSSHPGDAISQGLPKIIKIPVFGQQRGRPKPSGDSRSSIAAFT